MSTTLPQGAKAYRGLAMEGCIARWYARNTANNRAGYRTAAEMIARQIRPGSSVLEVAPGPGYLAIELARLGNYRIVGLDISESFVQIATENAAQAGVAVTFQQGNASAMPFEAGSFDCIVCRAAFKNFADPVGAMAEMHRVLRVGGTAFILDLRPDATNAAIAAEVRGMELGWLNSLLTKLILRRLRKRAYSQRQFREMAAQTPFCRCEIEEESIGQTVRLTK
jgi:ubiquinone/menaquinone biosynthesis C-methylase UbiE